MFKLRKCFQATKVLGGLYVARWLDAALEKRSQTCRPQEGPMRPANIRKNGDFKRNIGPIGLFSQKHWILTQKCFLHFKCGPPDLAFSVMRSARHFEFETPALECHVLLFEWP